MPNPTGRTPDMKTEMMKTGWIVGGGKAAANRGGGPGEAPPESVAA